MDRFVRDIPAVLDGDLAFCLGHGIAYQIDRSHMVDYDRAYYDKCAGYEGQEIERRINHARVEFVARHFSGNLLDVGIGSGAFIKTRRERTYGFDVNPVGQEWLKRNDLWSDRINYFGAVSFWDVLEHVPDPSTYLDRIQLHGFVFLSMPIFDDIRRVRQSKHYRPGEHLQYFEGVALCDWMNWHGFMLLEANDEETTAGRESIQSFAFRRYRCPMN